METVIITAGGIGKRMKGTIPKQFLCIANTPILMHTIRRFHNYNSKIQIILTLPVEWLSYWEELQEKYQFKIAHEIVDGGKERFHSIQNALRIATGDVIGVHDGVRPFVSLETIQSCYSEAKMKGTAIPFLPISESMREIGLGSSRAINRKNFVTVQTPQCFQKVLLNEAYKQPYHDGITDDASLVEQLGIEIQLVPGNEENIKITTPNDLKIAELFI